MLKKRTLKLNVMDNLRKMFPYEIRKRRSDRFSVWAILWTLFGGLVIILLSLVGLFDPYFNKVDEFTSSLKGQAVAFVVIVAVVCGMFALTFLKRKFNEWRNE